MTLPSTQRKAGPFDGNDATTAFPFTFKVFAAADIAVSMVDADDIETTLVLDSDYTVSLNANQDTSPGGTVTYPVSGDPLAEGESLVIVGDIDYDQTLDLPSGGNFSPRAMENALDRATMQIQQVVEEVDRALKIPVTSDSSADLPAPEASTVIGWSSDASELQNYALADLATSIAFATYRVDPFTGDGVETEFNLTSDPVSAGNLQVFGDGFLFDYPDDYTFSGTTLTFTQAPADGEQIRARYGQGHVSGVSADANDVNYQPAGAGAVARTAQAKMRESVSVKDFGATGDGVTNDTAAINLALASGAKHITMPAGTYILGSELQLYGNDITLSSDDGAVIKQTPAVAVSFAAMRLRGSRVRLVGITFDGNNASPPVSGDNNAVSLDTNSGTIENVAFERCTFQNFNGYGINAFAAGTLTGVVIDGCLFKSFTNTAATPKAAIQLVQPLCSNILVRGNRFESITGACFAVRSVAGASEVANVSIVGNIFANNSFTYTSMGAEVWEARNLSISGNVFRDMRIGASCFGSNIGVSGNSFENCTSYCYEGIDSLGISIAGNSFKDFTYGVIFTTGAKDISIVGNTFRGALGLASANEGWALQLSQSGITQNYERLTFSDNTLYDCSGVRIDRVTLGVVSGNVFDTISTDNPCRLIFTDVLTQSVTITDNRFRTSIDLATSGTGLVNINGSKLTVQGNSLVSTTGAANVGVGIINQAAGSLTDVHLRFNYVENFSTGISMNSGAPTISGVTSADNIFKSCTTTQNGSAGVTLNLGQFKSGQQALSGDADATLTTASKGTLRFTGNLTANRTITLPVTGPLEGTRHRFIRVSGNTGGPWTQSIGGLKNLAQNEWCDVEYSGSAWVLAAFGAL